MLRGTTMYAVAVCSVCGHIIVYRPATQDKPDVCPRCGAGPESELLKPEGVITGGENGNAAN